MAGKRISSRAIVLMAYCLYWIPLGLGTKERCMLDCTRQGKENYCPYSQALAREFVDFRDHDDIGEDLQNRIPRQSFNLQYRVAEFFFCDVDEDDESEDGAQRRLREALASEDEDVLRRLNELQSNTTQEDEPIEYSMTMMPTETLPDSPVGGYTIHQDDWLYYDDRTYFPGAAEGFFEFNFSDLNATLYEDNSTRFVFYGTAFRRAILSSNGFITFGGNTTTLATTMEDVFAVGLPRISAVNTDLMPENSTRNDTRVSWKKVTSMASPKQNRLVITFENVPRDPKSMERRRAWVGQDSYDAMQDVSTFQVALFPLTGKIRLAWLDVSNTSTATAGITPRNMPAGFKVVGIDEAVGCEPNPTCLHEDLARPIGPTRPFDKEVIVQGLDRTYELGLSRPHPYLMAEYPNPHAQFCQAGCTFYYTAQNWLTYTAGYDETEKRGGRAQAGYGDDDDGAGTALEPTASPTTPEPTLFPTEMPTNFEPTVAPTAPEDKNTLQLCLDRCDFTYQYKITVGYSDIAELARLECWDGCQIANYRCQPGYYCFRGMMLACPVGHHRNVSYHHVEQCYLCPAGRYRDRVGGRSAEDCDLCPTGKFIDVDGSDQVSDCKRCPAGRFGAEPGVAKCKCISERSCIDRPDGIATLTGDEAEYEVREEYLEDLREKRDTVPFIGRF